MALKTIFLRWQVHVAMTCYDENVAPFRSALAISVPFPSQTNRCMLLTKQQSKNHKPNGESHVTTFVLLPMKKHLSQFLDSL